MSRPQTVYPLPDSSLGLLLPPLRLVCTVHGLCGFDRPQDETGETTAEKGDYVDRYGF